MILQKEKKDTKDHSWHKYGFLTHQKRLSWNICWCRSVGKEFACNVGDPDSIPGQGRSPREGNNYPLQYSCLEDFMDRGAWQLQSKGSQGVRHDWVTNTFTFPFWIHLKFQLLKKFLSIFQFSSYHFHRVNFSSFKSYVLLFCACVDFLIKLDTQ